jgi:dihydroneopterin aldolase
MKAVRIIKLGGSLLELPDVRSRFEDWLGRREETWNLVIVGGGKLVDAIRRYDQVHALAATAAHSLAIGAMGLSAELFAQLMPKLLLVRGHTDPRSIIYSGRTIIFEVRQFLDQLEPKLPGRRLPENWTVTSDSIAARIACVVSAAELVLLKSCDLPEGAAHEELAASNHVDPHFPEAVSGIPYVRWVNLRKAGFPAWDVSAKSYQ